MQIRARAQCHWVENSAGEKVWQWKTVQCRTWVFQYRRKSITDKWSFVSQLAVKP